MLKSWSVNYAEVDHRGAGREESPTRHFGQAMGMSPSLRWLAVIFWMGVIFALSATPSLASPFEPYYDFILRKLAHIGEYAVLTALLFWALRSHLARRWQILLISVFIAILYAFSDEWHQTFVPGRDGSLRDVGINALGIAGMFVWLRGIRRR